MEVSSKHRMRKRMDARAFRESYKTLIKKPKVCASTPESRDDTNDVNSSIERNSKNPKIDHEPQVKPEAGNGDGISRVPEQSQELSDCKTKLPRYVEYWVPVCLSYVQLEKYCETLHKNKLLLCANLKKGVLDGLNNILTTIKKCCDHPYLVDTSLQKFVHDRRPIDNYLINDIEGSGKILLLDKLLKEVKRKQLRVLIVFQWNDSKLHSMKLQHILDDLICANVGEEFYIHIYREFDSAKKRAAVDLFNDNRSGKLVMLIEKGSCQSNIKLSSVDSVILFNSDWSPINDIKSLQKMSIQSKFDHLKVFRLYTSNSVEEKALILAKEGTAVESNLNNFSLTINHMLLLWGTSYLFSKLDELHSRCSSVANLDHLSDDKLVLDVLNELSALLSCQDSDTISCSLISKVREANGDYSQDIALHGEQDEPFRDDDLRPTAIWNSLLEGRNPRWKLLPGSSEGIRRRGEPTASSAQNVECMNETSKMMSKKTPHLRDRLFFLKPKEQNICGPSPSKRAGKIFGHPKSPGNAVELSSYRDNCSSVSQIENTCLRRMRELVLKQKKEIREFYRTKREERAKLEEEHQLELDLMNQRFRETTLKQEKLNMLDLIYEQKLKEHNHRMDTKRKKLEDEHLASRIKEKQMKDKWLGLLKTKNLGIPITSLDKLSLLENAVGQQPVGLETGVVSESNYQKDIEFDVMNESLQCDDPGCPAHVLTETEVLSIDSNDENDSVFMQTEQVAKPNDLVSSPAMCASTSTPPCENQFQASNREIEGDGSTTTKSPKEMTHYTTTMCPVSGSLESDGENDVDIMLSGEEHETFIEVLNHGSNVCTLNEDQLHTSSGHSYAESLSNMPDREVQDGDCSTEALVVATNGEAEIKGAPDLGSTATVAGCQRIEQLQGGDCNTEAIIFPTNREAEIDGSADLGNTTASEAVRQRVLQLQDGHCDSEGDIGLSNAESEIRGATALGTTATVTGRQRIEQLQDGQCNVESAVGLSNGEAEMKDDRDMGINATVAEQHRIEVVHDEDCNIETPVVMSNGETEMRGVADLGITATMATQQAIEELMEPPQSRLNANSQVLVQPQTSSITGNSLQLEQPTVFVNIPCNETRQSDEASVVSVRQTSRLLAPSQPSQTQVHVRSLGLSDQPVVQTHWQSTAGREQPRNSNSGGIANMRLANNNFQGSSTRSNNLLPSAGFDPLQNELVRMSKEEEEVSKIHEDKKMNLKAACEKEIAEINKKYDLLLREADHTFLQKKLEMKSNYQRVLNHKILADALKYTNQKQTLSSLSPESLMNAILQFAPMQFYLPVERPSVMSAEPTPTTLPLQVVQHLSELVSFDAIRPHNFSTLYNTGNPPADYNARSSAPHLRPPGSASSVWLHGSSLQNYSTPQNPRLL